MMYEQHFGMRADGLVLNGVFDVMQEKNIELKRELLEQAPDKKIRDLLEKIWPFQHNAN